VYKLLTASPGVSRLQTNPSLASHDYLITLQHGEHVTHKHKDLDTSHACFLRRPLIASKPDVMGNKQAPSEWCTNSRASP